MERLSKPGEELTPEKMQEKLNMLEKMNKDLQYLDAKLQQYRKNMAAAKDGTTPELRAYYDNQKAQFEKYSNVYESKLNMFQQIVLEEEALVEARIMKNTEAILRKMLIASEKDPSLREEANEWVASYKKAFGKKDVFGI